MITHYLITFQIQSNVYFHAYLIAPTRAHVEHAVNMMQDQAKRDGFKHVLMHAILVTTLIDGVDEVRRIFSDLDEKAKENIQTATDYHLTMCQMRDDHPDNARLLAFH